MDMATDLRARMAINRKTVAEVATMVGRTTTTVTGYRTGQRPIPLDVAQVLYANDLLSRESLLGEQGAA